MGVTVTRLTALVLSLYMLLGQRLTIGASTGGRGTVSPLEVLFIALAGLLWLGSKLESQRAGARGLLWVSVGPLFTLLIVMPFFGVLLEGYQLRALYSWVVVLVPLGIFVLGAAATRYGVNLRAFALVAIVGHGMYGLGQQLNRLGILPTSMWGWAAAWDINSQAAYDQAYVLTSRSTGLFLNPNAFGLWSVLAVVFGALYLRRFPRIAAIILGAIGVVGSQSRTAWLALALLILGYFVAFMGSRRVASAGTKAALLLVPVAALLSILGVFSKLVEQGALTRLTSGVDALTQGSSADANLSGRYVGWQRAQEFVSTYAVGTLGPPQVKFGNSIDSQFVSFYVQGGPLLVAAFLITLASPFILRRRLPGWWKLAVIAGVVAVFSYTANSLDSPVAGALAWVGAILTVRESITDDSFVQRQSTRSQPRKTLSARS